MENTPGLSLKIGKYVKNSLKGLLKYPLDPGSSLIRNLKIKILNDLGNDDKLKRIYDAIHMHCSLLVHFGNKFNQPVNNLPESITRLTFGWCFNHPVENLPGSITHLNFGESFNQPTDHLSKDITITHHE